MDGSSLRAPPHLRLGRLDVEGSSAGGRRPRARREWRGLPRERNSFHRVDRRESPLRRSMTSWIARCARRPCPFVIKNLVELLVSGRCFGAVDDGAKVLGASCRPYLGRLRLGQMLGDENQSLPCSLPSRRRCALESRGGGALSGSGSGAEIGSWKASQCRTSATGLVELHRDGAALRPHRVRRMVWP